MIPNENIWQDYWAKRDDPGHRFATIDWYRFCANELMLYFPQGDLRAFEFGCGDGVLFDFLKARFRTYVGADFSPVMLSKFKQRIQDVNLICADITRLPIVNNKYDLLYSNGVCQYFDEEMLRRNLKQVRSLMEHAGTYLIANIPDEQLRIFLYAGALRGDRDQRWARAIRQWLSIKLSGQQDGLGHWYSRRRFSRIAKEMGYSCKTYSSSSLEYRFHAVLQVE